MPKVSAKRQITLPIDLCRDANIAPGDEIDAYVYNGHITIVKKEKAAAKGMLRDKKADKTVTDEQSLHSTIEQRRKRST